MAAMPAATRFDSASGKKPGVCAAVSDRKPHPLRALWAVAFVGGLVAVDIYASVNFAALKRDAYEFALAGLLAAAALAGRAVAGQI